MIEAFMTLKFLQYALIAAVLIGFTAPLIGSFVVVRRMSLIADALSHVTLAGIALSLLISGMVASLADLNPLYLGIVTSVIAALTIDWLRAKYKHFQELAIPIIMATGMGLGAIFISLANGFSMDLVSFLFGTVSAVTLTDVYTIFIVTGVVIVFVIAFYKELLFLSFDEEQARVSGIRLRLVHILFMIVVALVIAISMRVVGILLVSSLITLPVAAALRFAKSFKATIFYAIVFGEVATITGLILAYQFDLAPGGMIVMLAVIELILVMIIERFWIGGKTHEKKHRTSA
ncbi:MULTISPECIES: metal ABC transporter permease [Exiguobacterium]|uniref:Metal ABC transporter permease n=1 Tax=Exiguobacterium antarcticum TaxID=132920 RepID=A0ABT6QZS6_9BACL|nr:MULTISPECIES: metal ABC transporter permease [Exiguobacterium]AFS69964.1 ABC transporter [Exiguobacterium antarcticum B7]MDI3234088.1 metal ABC transporter permease [Exiguobacterium antarcticum]